MAIGARDESAAGVAPRVSVIIPAYNDERYLASTVSGVLAQTLQNWELVISDDGSTDRTAALARQLADSDERIRVIRGENCGVATARNRGLAATDARSEFVIFLDHDDIWESDTLETLVGVLDTRPEYVSAYGLARCIDGDGRMVSGDDLESWMRCRRGYRSRRLVAIAAEEPTTFADMVVESWLLTPGTHLVRRSVAERVGDFDRLAVPADDWDMAIRVSRCGPIGFVSRPLLRWRRHPGAQSDSSPRWRQAHYFVRDKTVTDRSNTPGQFEVACLAYAAVGRGRLADARVLFASRRLAAGVRQLARGVHAALRYSPARTMRLAVSRGS